MSFEVIAIFKTSMALVLRQPSLGTSQAPRTLSVSHKCYVSSCSKPNWGSNHSKRVSLGRHQSMQGRQCLGKSYISHLL